MTKKQKLILYRIIVTAVIFAALTILKYTGIIEGTGSSIFEALFYLIPYFLISYDIIIKAAKNIRHGQIFDENFLMLIAGIAAFGIGEYGEAVAVMLLYQVGELFQGYAVEKSRKSISDMMDICPEYANVETDGKLVETEPQCVKTGSIIVIKLGERVPIDGVVIQGESLVDTSALTGESVPVSVCAGSEIISGCVNTNGTLKVKTVRAFEDSTVNRILELTENASSKKARTESFITRFARIYTPVVTVLAVILALVPALIIGDGFEEWIKRACIFLVISCPCALVISVPLGFFGGIGAASKAGILVKGGNYLEALSRVGTVVFDKTGTLTKGNFEVTEILPACGVEAQRLLELAALSESYSNHPIASSIRAAYGKNIPLNMITDTKDIAGSGIYAKIGEDNVYVGNAKLMHEKNINFTESECLGTAVYVAMNDKLLGCIVISDTVKDGAAEAIGNIKKLGVKKCVMLTGDRRKVGEAVGAQVGLDEVHCELLPDDKVRITEKLLSSRLGKERLVFVGDGINDAPVLSRADIGVAMGSMGSDAAIEAADVVIMDDDIGKIAHSIKIAKRTVRIVKENIAFALVIKLAFMILGVFGAANMWMAVFGDVGVSVISILNSMRAMNYRR